MPGYTASAVKLLSQCVEDIDEASDIIDAESTIRDALQAIRYLQSSAGAGGGDEKLKSELDTIADDLHTVYGKITDHDVQDRDNSVSKAELETIGDQIEEAYHITAELVHENKDIDELANWTTSAERFENIGEALYDHPDLAKPVLEELFSREPGLEPPYGRVVTDNTDSE